MPKIRSGAGKILSDKAVHELAKPVCMAAIKLADVIVAVEPLEKHDVSMYEVVNKVKESS